GRRVRRLTRAVTGSAASAAPVSAGGEPGGGVGWQPVRGERAAGDEHLAMRGQGDVPLAAVEHADQVAAGEGEYLVGGVEPAHPVRPRPGEAAPEGEHPAVEGE